MLKKTDAVKYRATDLQNRPVSSGFFASDTHAIGAFKEELSAGRYHIYKGKDDEFVRDIHVAYETTEVCPHCDSEVTLNWSVKDFGYAIYCPYCGQRMMLCDECTHAADNHEQKCDWCESGCWRTRNVEKEAHK